MWKKVSLLLCIYGFFRELRPSEPYVTEFLAGEWRNITAEQVFRDVYPWGTYSYLAVLVIVFLVTDIVRYKPFIILSACIGCIIWSMLIWTTSLIALQIVQLLYGTFMATEVAYYTYIYAKVEREEYQKVTGFTRAATLTGRFTAGIIAQVLVSFRAMNLLELNYITLASQFVSLAWAIALPAVGSSIYFYAKDEKHKAAIEEQTYRSVFAAPIAEEKPTFSGRNALHLLWTHFYESYTDWKVLQWSFWWALAMCGFMQVQTYMQLLWHDINPGMEQENLYNGAVEAALTLLGVGGAMLAGFINNERIKKWDVWILATCSAIEGLLLLWAALSAEVWGAYVAYILFGMLYHFMITVASVNVAKRLKDDSFGLVFGINTLVALALQTVLTVLVVADGGFALDPRGQYFVYAGYFVALATLYGCTGFCRFLCRKYRERKG